MEYVFSLQHSPSYFQDGFTALALAAKEGFSNIVSDLLLKGAYVNLVDRVGSY